MISPVEHLKELKQILDGPMPPPAGPLPLKQGSVVTIFTLGFYYRGVVVESIETHVKLDDAVVVFNTGLLSSYARGIKDMGYEEERVGDGIVIPRECVLSVMPWPKC